MSRFLGVLAILALLVTGCTGTAAVSTSDGHRQVQDERQHEAGSGGGGGY
jgi:hypothetical protein